MPEIALETEILEDEVVVALDAAAECKANILARVAM
jgi:hypothetical protein